jgi:hypothetical protein
METNMLLQFSPFQFIYRKLNLGKTIWDKTKVLFGTSWGKYLRILWEQSGEKKIPLCPPQRKKLYLFPLHAKPSH